MSTLNEVWYFDLSVEYLNAKSWVRKDVYCISGSSIPQDILTDSLALSIILKQCYTKKTQKEQKIRLKKVIKKVQLGLPPTR